MSYYPFPKRMLKYMLNLLLAYKGTGTCICIVPIVSTILATSRKHAYIILTPLNPTFIKYNWGLQG